MKIRLEGDPSKRYDTERHDRRFEHIFGAGSGQGGQSERQDVAAKEARDYFRAGDRAMIVGLTESGEIYNDLTCTVTSVDETGPGVLVLLDRPPHNASAELKIKLDHLMWQSDIKKTGDVYKRGQINTAFKLRFFVLEGGRLSYFKSKDEALASADLTGDQHEFSVKAALGSLNLIKSSLEPNVEGADNRGTWLGGKRLYCFALTDAEGRRLHCGLASKDHHDAWVHTISAAILATNLKAYAEG